MKGLSIFISVNAVLVGDFEKSDAVVGVLSVGKADSAFMAP